MFDLIWISYGEVGFSVARKIYENDKHKFDAGITLKFLFPGSYSNFGLSNLKGTITQNPSGSFLANLINSGASDELIEKQKEVTTEARKASAEERKDLEDAIKNKKEIN